MKAVILNYGCKVNQYESDSLYLSLNSFINTSLNLEYADYYIINTCAVTNEAERKSRQAVNRCLKYNDKAYIYVIGCASEKNKEQFFKKKGVVYVGGTNCKSLIIEDIKNRINNADSVSNINNADYDSAIDKADSVSKINNADYDSAIDNANSVSKINNADSVFRVKNTDIVSKIDNSDCVTNIDNTDSVSSIDNINYVSKIDTSVTFNPSSYYDDSLISNPVRDRTLIKIQDGCNNYCSYCIVPYLRGVSRSRDINSVLDDIKTQASHTKEIVLTGINISAYGLDISYSLTELINKISKLNLNVYIRLGSLSVNVIDTTLMEALVKLKFFCPHFHLSLQSGDSRVLADMNRRYTLAEFKDATHLIREYYSNAAITTDIIVGYPTEKEECFINSYNFIKGIGFSDIHIFPYSMREGTTAYALGSLEKSVVASRITTMSELKKELKNRYLIENIGKITKFIAEKIKDGYTEGYSPEYIRVYVKGNYNQGDIIRVKLTHIFKDGLGGEIVGNN